MLTKFDEQKSSLRNLNVSDMYLCENFYVLFSFGNFCKNLVSLNTKGYYFGAVA